MDVSRSILYLKVSLLSLQAEIVYIIIEKWLSALPATGSLDRDRVRATVNKLYRRLGYPPPKIVFFASPFELLSWLIDRQFVDIFKPGLVGYFYRLFLKIFGKFTDNYLSGRLAKRNFKTYGVPIGSQIFELQDAIDSRHVDYELASMAWLADLDRDSRQLMRHLETQLIENFSHYKWREMGRKLHAYIEEKIAAIWMSEDLLNTIIFADLCQELELVNIPHDDWQLSRELLLECGWLLPTSKYCLVSERPIRVCHDQRDTQPLHRQECLHAIGTPAIEYSDGYALWAIDGVVLPDKYAGKDPSKWRADWLLSETNPEVRRLLIQYLGYSKIAESIKPTKIDTWKEYTLLKIDRKIDIEPILLLRYKCPQTQEIHLTRVPPHHKSAKQAITWINWGFSPEEF
jgi:hypothetical protein